jgi:hypothetical protein
MIHNSNINLNHIKDKYYSQINYENSNYNLSNKV